MLNGRKTTRSVHSLVCSAFYGPPPFPGAQVRHLDGNYKNSQPSNLAWGTRQDNWRDRRAHGNGAEGEKHHHSNFTDEERGHIRWAVGKGLASGRHAARVLGVSQCSILGILQGNETLAVDQDLPANRIPVMTLELTEVRVKRLQDISEADAITEGIEPVLTGTGEQCGWLNYDHEGDGVGYCTKPVDSYATLWRRINGPDAWDENPWVWIPAFRVHQQNVDAFLAAKGAA
ncbi:HNH endonuclease signature motif containing protein [Fimbriiglobus ruber]